MAARSGARRPNIMIVLNDDMGYSDLGCFGGEVDTPNYNRLAENGLRFTQFYASPRCSPTRACLLTGLHPHQTGIGILTGRDSPDGYPGNLNRNCVTLAEVLKEAGYATYMSGKWHITENCKKPNGAWPTERGFQKYYGMITGCGDYYQPCTLCRGAENVESEALNDPNFYLTDAISDTACGYIREHANGSSQAPFFLYVAYTAPHWPLQAKPADLAKYKGRFNAGWDKLREERLLRMRRMGLLQQGWALSERDPAQPPWEQAANKEWQLRRMESYAAQIDCADQGLGRIIRALEQTGQLDNTLIFCLSDNGGCAEELDIDWQVVRWGVARAKTHNGLPVRVGNDPKLMPGTPETYQSYGVPWANLSNTPYRMYKHWVHEGGIATPLIAHWPEHIKERGALRHQLGQLTDFMPTVLEVSGAQYPKRFAGRQIPPFEGSSLVPLFDNRPNGRGPLFWEHEGNAAVRDGKWKLVKNFTAAKSATPGFDPPNLRGRWELYDMERDRTELRDLAAEHPQRVASLSAAYEAWAKRCLVIDREIILGNKKPGQT